MNPKALICTVIVAGTLLSTAVAGSPPGSNSTKKTAHRIPARQAPTTPQPAEGEVLLKYAESVLSGKTPQERARQMDKLATALHDKFGITVLSNSGAVAVQRVELPVGLSPEAITALSKEPGIERAGFNYKIYPAASPNDPEWEATDISPPDFNLWGLRKIGMEYAWLYSTGDTGHLGVVTGGTTGRRGIVIAVIDTGIDYLHGDLAPNMWTNPDEIPGDGIDNDGNGIIDDIHGADFCTHPRSGNPMDMDGHGTLVAGTIAAVGNNGQHVVGVSWHAKLMALKFMCYIDPNTHQLYGLMSDAIDAIVYATDKNASVMNNSWHVAGSPPYLADLSNAIRRANCESSPTFLPSPGCLPALFVAAAGNADGRSPTLNNDVQPAYPANFPINNVISVAATDKQDQLWADSRWGPNSVHIAAPGVAIESTYLRNEWGGLSITDGTSMAAPHVTGCAALLLAKGLSRIGGGLLDIPSLKDALLKTGDPSLSLAGKVQFGTRLNCNHAMGSLFPFPFVTIAPVVPDGPSPPFAPSIGTIPIH